LSAIRRLRIGSAKAAVLPVPVWAMPIRSPLREDGNSLRLDGRRLGVAHLGQRGDERRGKAEAVKIFQVMIFQTAAMARKIPRGGLVSLKGTPRVSGRLGDLQTGARQEDSKALHAAGAHRPFMERRASYP
jgi:hypothetical protein